MREEFGWWLSAARKSLERAERAFEFGDYEAAAFWSQQAVEFSLKAAHVLAGRLPPRTHHLPTLLRGVEGLVEVRERHLLSELTPYYSISRYPDAFGGTPVVAEETASRFLRFARGVVSEVEGLGRD